MDQLLEILQWAAILGLLIGVARLASLVRELADLVKDLSQDLLDEQKEKNSARNTELHD